MTNNWNFETRREEPNVLSIDCEESVRSFDASQYSDGHSISSDDNLFQLPDLEKDLMVRNSSPRLPITSNDAAQNDLDQKNIEDQDEQEYCKEVRCIELEEPITNQHTHSNSEYLRSNTYSDSSASSPRAKTDLQGSIVVDDVNKNDTDFCSSGIKEDKTMNHLREYFALPTPESSTPWPTENSRISSSSSSRPSRLSRSRSCKASLMKNLPSDWFEDDEEIQNTPPVGNEKDFTGRPEGFLKKVHTLNYNANAERNSMESSAADESGINGLLTTKRKETENLKRLNLLADHEVSFFFEVFLVLFSFHFLLALFPSHDYKILATGSIDIYF